MSATISQPANLLGKIVSLQEFRNNRQEQEFGDITLPDGTVITSEKRREIARAMVVETALEVKARITSGQSS